MYFFNKLERMVVSKSSITNLFEKNIIKNLILFEQKTQFETLLIFEDEIIK